MEINADMITQFGLMNKISTGNSAVDVLLCMLVPILIRQVLPRVAEWARRLLVKAPASKKTVTRTIEFTQRNSYNWWESNADPSNSVLQKALLNYVNQFADVLRKLPSADVLLKKRPISNSVAKASVDEVDEAGADNDGASSSDSEGQSNTEHDYDVNVAPPEGSWIELKSGVRFMRQQESLDDKNKQIKCTYFLEADEPGGNAAIEAFIQEALELYKRQQSAKVADVCRYMYVPVLSSFRGLRAADGDGEGKGAAVQYKRYKLSDEKTFASFFHPDKDGIINLVDSFTKRTGKFSIPGYPRKLGFLLYGPPGTGKTSFIKALATYTKRSIISIPLSKISTNQELMDIMQDQRIQVENDSSSSLSLPFSKTIFVMEDVDAASSVVQRRSPSAASTSASLAAHAAAEAYATAAAAAAERKQAAAAARRKASASRGSDDGSSAASSHSHDGHEEQDQDDGKGKGKKANDDTDSSDDEGGAGGAMAASARARGSAHASSSSLSLSSPGGGVSFGPALPGSNFKSSFFKGDDELNLAGLLNVLDGVIDTPGRIVIMTSNHPEKLDPALIRPGRINKKIYMGRLLAPQMQCMVQHYFGPLSDEDRAGLASVWCNDVISPAQLEAACAEYDSVAELTSALAGMVAEHMAGTAESFRPC